ncbi:methyltransferase [Pseudomonas guariconensis]|uniref:methyltransferase n=1 Tax=Pseudomonas guariconensis TaxID=1288410 RepID=UPI00366A92EE
MVKLLKRHVPKSAKKILDPAVGEGALLDALSTSQLNESLTLVDIDPKRLDAIRVMHSGLSLISADFITWSSKNHENKYDLIITNPPFSARSENWISHERKKLPIELVFFRKCVSLLQTGGTLLAIVPDTIVNSSRLESERARFASEGAFVYAYQLPARSFFNIEGAFYLLVFKKGIKQSCVTLRNTNGSVDLKIAASDFARLGHRLDHSFYQSTFLLEGLISSSTQPLLEICKIGRGPIRNNYKHKSYVHSDSFENGAWRSYRDEPSKTLCIGVKRVSRDAHLSFGLFPTSAITNSTDCIIFIQPQTDDVFSILFYLRTIFSNDSGKSMLLKGAGAKFIQVEALKKLPYFSLAEKYPSEYIAYKDAYENFDFTACAKIENAVYTSLIWGSKVSTLHTARNQTKNIKPSLVQASIVS